MTKKECAVLSARALTPRNMADLLALWLLPRVFERFIAKDIFARRARRLSVLFREESLPGFTTLLPLFWRQ